MNRNEKLILVEDYSDLIREPRWTPEIAACVFAGIHPRSLFRDIHSVCYGLHIQGQHRNIETIYNHIYPLLEYMQNNYGAFWDNPLAFMKEFKRRFPKKISETLWLTAINWQRQLIEEDENFQFSPLHKTIMLDDPNSLKDKNKPLRNNEKESFLLTIAAYTRLMEELLLTINNLDGHNVNDFWASIMTKMKLLPGFGPEVRQGTIIKSNNINKDCLAKALEAVICTLLNEEKENVTGMSSKTITSRITTADTLVASKKQPSSQK